MADFIERGVARLRSVERAEGAIGEARRCAVRKGIPDVFAILPNVVVFACDDRDLACAVSLHVARCCEQCLERALIRSVDERARLRCAQRRGQAVRLRIVLRWNELRQAPDRDRAARRRDR